MDNVMCPWCKEEMELEMETCGVDAHDIPEMYRTYFECDKCGSRTPSASVFVNYSEKPHGVQCLEAAYLAAARRPPNLPLTKEQLFDLPEDDAIWAYFLSGELKGIASVSCFYGMNIDGDIKILLFAAKPTTADIESAREGK